MYYLEWEELGGVIVNNRVTEEIIKITFGDNWLIAAFVFVVAVSAILNFFSGMSILVRCG